MNSTSLQPTRHGFLTRVFLRDCAFLIRLYGQRDSQWIWNFAALATSVTLSSIALLIFTAAVVVFRLALPEYLNPLTAERQIVLLEIAAVTLSVGFWVDYRFRKFKHDVSAARAYMSASDLLLWWLSTFVTVGCTLGIGLLVVVGREGRFMLMGS